MLSVDQMKETLTRIVQKLFCKLVFTKNLLFVYLFFLFHVKTIRFIESFEKNHKNKVWN